MLKRKRNEITKQLNDSNNKIKKMAEERNELRLKIDTEHDIIEKLLEKDVYLQKEIQFNDIMKDFIDEENLTDIIFQYGVRLELSITDGQLCKKQISINMLKRHDNFLEIVGPFELWNLFEFGNNFYLQIEIYAFFPFTEVINHSDTNIYLYNIYAKCRILLNMTVGFYNI